jgi:hypothetical protein
MSSLRQDNGIELNFIEDVGVCAGRNAQAGF